MNVPEGAPLVWAPLYDFVLATVAKVLPGGAEPAVELAGAVLPPILGILQVLILALLLRRLVGYRTALLGTAIAAVLPGAVRFALLGASDHDPLIELATLGVLAAMAGASTTAGGPSLPVRRGAIEVAFWLTVLVLTWPGALIHIGLFATVGLVTAAVAGWRSESSLRLGIYLALGGLGAAVVLLPFVLGSIWTASIGASYEGLSWLQEAAVLALALAGSLLALRSGQLRGYRRRFQILGGTSAVALVLLIPICLPSLLAGLTFLGRSEPWLQSIAESRPLLALFGRLDLRPLLVRLSLIPLLLPFLAIWLWRQKAERVSTAFLVSWTLFTLSLALFQARYSHGAAFALAALAAFAAAQWLSQASLAALPRRAYLLVGLIFLPCLAAYLPLPGFGGLRFIGRVTPLVATGMEDVSLFLRAAAPPPVSWEQPDKPAEESVLGPWSAGHWFEWIGQKATVASPFGSHGQPSFHDAARFYFLREDQEIAALLERRRVRWVVVESDLLKLEHAARMAEVDPDLYLGARTPDGLRPVKLNELMETIGARLAFAAESPSSAQVAAPVPPAGLREVFRTVQLRPGPFGPVPLIRVYEVDPSGLAGSR